MSGIFEESLRRVSKAFAAIVARPSPDDMQSVLRGTLGAAAITAFNAVCYALYSIDPSNLGFMGVWLAATLGICAVLLFKSRASRMIKVTRVSARAHRRLIVWTGLFALPWSVLAFFILGFGGAGDPIASALVCLGMATGGIFMLHRALGAAFVYATTVLASVAAAAFMGDHPSAWPILAYSVSYVCFLTVFAFATGETARERDKSIEILSKVVEDLQTARDDNQRLANIDVVTGLPNRKSFNETLQREIERSRTTGEPFTLLCLDLDHFKNVNDVFGHSVGDKLLATIGERLNASIDPSFTVARLGGDEFAVVMTGKHAQSDIIGTADKIIAAVSKLCEIDGVTLQPATSIGAATCPDHGQDAHQILSKADLALNKAKEKGRGRSMVFNEDLRNLIRLKEKTETALRRALDEHEIQIVYQPKVNLKDGSLAGAEAFVRWTDADLGVMEPDVFLPLAAERALLPALSRYIADRVASDIRGWKEKGVNFGKIALNIHAIDLKSPDALLTMIDSLEEQGATHREIMLEITEGCFVGRGTDKTLFILDNLAERGYDLALDDFGTGHASLSHLKMLPVSEIKIDRSFVSALEHDRDDLSIVAAIAEVARGMGVRSIAEGVENPRQRDILEEMGVDVGQGYLWSPGVDASTLATLVSRFSQVADKSA